MSWVKEADLPDLPEIFRSISSNSQALELVERLNEGIAFGSSALTRAQEEAIATTVSVANRCRYGALTHGGFFRKHARDADTASQLLTDYTQANLSEADQVMLEFSAKVTLEPGSLTEQNVEELREVGFNDDQIVSIVLVTCLFNFMNRIASSLGVDVPMPFVRSVASWVTGPVAEESWLLGQDVGLKPGNLSWTTLEKALSVLSKSNSPQSTGLETQSAPEEIDLSQTEADIPVASVPETAISTPVASASEGAASTPVVSVPEGAASTQVASEPEGAASTPVASGPETAVSIPVASVPEVVYPAELLPQAASGADTVEANLHPQIDQSEVGTEEDINSRPPATESAVPDVASSSYVIPAGAPTQDILRKDTLVNSVSKSIEERASEVASINNVIPSGAATQEFLLKVASLNAVADAKSTEERASEVASNHNSSPGGAATQEFLLKVASLNTVADATPTREIPSDSPPADSATMDSRATDSATIEQPNADFGQVEGFLQNDVDALATSEQSLVPTPVQDHPNNPPKLLVPPGSPPGGPPEYPQSDKLLHPALTPVALPGVPQEFAQVDEFFDNALTFVASPEVPQELAPVQAASHDAPVPSGAPMVMPDFFAQTEEIDQDALDPLAQPEDYPAASPVEELLDDSPSPIVSPVITPDFAQIEENLQVALVTLAQPEDFPAASPVEEIFDDSPSSIASPEIPQEFAPVQAHSHDAPVLPGAPMVVLDFFAQTEEIGLDDLDTLEQPEDSSSLSLTEELFDDALSPVVSPDDSSSLAQDDELPQDAINSVASPENLEESVKPARDAQLQSAIQLQQFMPECCAVGKEQACTARDLYLAYLIWCDQNLIPPMLQRNFGLGLTQLGFQRRRRSHGQHWWLGISVNAGVMGKMAA